MKILFVCKYNRFRSKIAEAYFKKINKNKKIKVTSGGVIKGKPTPKSVIKIARTVGISISGKPKAVSEKEIERIDLIVIVADNVPYSIFKNYKKVIVWKIPDARVGENERINKVIKSIINKVNKLVKELDKK